jgi:hypothetical protein
MSYPIFPDELSQAGPLNEPYSYAAGNTLVRTQMDSGAAKVRRKLSKPVDLISATYIFKDDAELKIFKDFVENTIHGGSLPFEYAVCGGDYMLVRLVPEEAMLYTVVRQSNRWSVTITLEVIDTVIDTTEEAAE